MRQMKSVYGFHLQGKKLRGPEILTDFRAAR
jgi:hypothetical protein